MYKVEPHADKMRWSVLDEKGRETGIYNSITVAKKECRRLNGEPKEEETRKVCYRFDADNLTDFLLCSVCKKEIKDGGFYYEINDTQAIICDSCQEGCEPVQPGGSAARMGGGGPSRGLTRDY